MWVYIVDRFAQALTPARAIAAVETTAAQFGLHKQMEQHKSARSHWHFQRPGKTGTLEVTFEPTPGRLLVIVHHNRIGADGWAKNDAPKFARRLAKELGGKTRKMADG